MVKNKIKIKFLEPLLKLKFKIKIEDYPIKLQPDEKNII